MTCKYGVLECIDGVEVVLCKNHRCKDAKCLYGNYTGGQIADDICEYFAPKEKDFKKESYT